MKKERHFKNFYNIANSPREGHLQQLRQISNPLNQGCQSHFHQEPHQPHSCLQRAKVILGLYKCNYSLTVKELKLLSTF